MKRTASAVWNGNLKAGKGTLSTEGGVLNKTPYSFATRFEQGAGTNPEELIAAAHAGCFTMQLSAFLAQAGFTADELATSATLTPIIRMGNRPAISMVTSSAIIVSGSLRGLYRRRRGITAQYSPRHSGSPPIESHY